jgi:hypothetical protein
MGPSDRLGLEADGVFFTFVFFLAFELSFTCSRTIDCDMCDV